MTNNINNTSANVSFKSTIINSASGRTRKEYNDELFNRSDRKEIIDLYHGNEEKPFASYGIQLSEFFTKEGKTLHHGFFKIIRLEGEEIRFSTLKKMLVESELGTQARYDSAELMAEGEDNPNLKVFECGVIDNPREPEKEYLAAVCKKSAKSEFSGKLEPTPQFFIIDKKTQRCAFVKPLFLNNLISLLNLELPEALIEEDDVEFEIEVVSIKK